MKIEKFKINESWNDNSFSESEIKELDSRKKQIEKEEQKLFPLLLEYLKLNPNSIEDSDIIEEDEDDLIQVTDFEIDNNKMFITIVDYSNDESQVEILSKYTSDLFEFLKDPVTYRNTRKFNL